MWHDLDDVHDQWNIQEEMIMKKMMAFILLIAMAFGLAGCAEKSPVQESSSVETVTQVQEKDEKETLKMGKAPQVETTLTKVSEIQDPQRAIREHWDGLILQDGEAFKLLSISGEPVTEESLIGYEYKGDGLYIVAADKEDVNHIGLVACTGEVLIDCEAASVSRLGDRYATVTYSTGVTENEDEMYFYITEALFSLSPSDGDEMHKGYSRIYDLEQKRFIDGVEVTNPYRYAIMSCGDTFAVQDEQGVTRIYDETGKVLAETDRTVETESGLYYISDWNEPTVLYDGSGMQIGQLEPGASVIMGSGTYMSVETDERQSQIADLQGNILSGKKYDVVYEEHNGLFEVKTEDGMYQLVCADGTVMAEMEDRYSSTYFGYGCYWVETKDLMRLISAEGILFETDADDARLSDDDYVFDFAKCDLVKPEQEVWQSYTKYLVQVRDAETKQYGVYDELSGKLVLPCEYDEISDAGDYLYARQDDTWTVFAVAYPEGAAE